NLSLRTNFPPVGTPLPPPPRAHRSKTNDATVSQSSHGRPTQYSHPRNLYERLQSNCHGSVKPAKHPFSSFGSADRSQLSSITDNEMRLPGSANYSPPFGSTTR